MNGLTLRKVEGMIQVCERKRVYKKRWLAEIAASHHDHPMRTYRCQVCDLWHLTSK